MSKINIVFNQIFRPLSVQSKALEDGVIGTEQFAQGTMRKQFIHELTTHKDPTIVMSQAGSASYYQMCRKRLTGDDMYASHKKWNKSNAEKSTVEVVVDISNRWWVGSKESKSVFASFVRRVDAQAHNKELKSQGIVSTWMDSTKLDPSGFTAKVA